MSECWKKCSSCKKDIGYSTKYYLCSVSTCRHSRKGFTFCSPSCWSEHLGFANHREAWAEDYVSPAKGQSVGGNVVAKQAQISNNIPATAVTSALPATPRKIVVGQGSIRDREDEAKRLSAETNQITTDTLVVVSKVKQFIRDESDFNTSQCCIDALTQKVIKECLKAIEEANNAGRKTVMGRDVK